MTPFGRKIVEDANPNSTLKIVLNVAWLFLFGWEIALMHLFHAVLLAITIIGLPFAKQHIKLLPLSLLPFGRSFERI